MIAPMKKVNAKTLTGASMREQYITKKAWMKIFNFLKGHEDIYVSDEAKCKNFIEGIFWMMRTGAQWRELPEEYGKWNTVFKRFNEWSKKNIWSDLNNYCIEDPDLEWVMIDATIVRAHACAAGYKKGQYEEQGLGRSKGGFTSKIHTLVDALGNSLKFIITGGNRNDITQAQELIKNIKDANILGDKGYDSDDFRIIIKNQNCNPLIPGKSNRIVPVKYDKHIYESRHLIENFFSKIKHFRRIFSRFDKSLRNFASFVAFAGTILWLR
jgi:transposase